MNQNVTLSSKTFPVERAKTDQVPVRDKSRAGLEFESMESTCCHDLFHKPLRKMRLVAHLEFWLECADDEIL